MPRPPRFDLPDAVYHVTCRGNGRAVVFWNDDDRLRFLAQLADNLRLADVVRVTWTSVENLRKVIHNPSASDPAREDVA